MLMFRSPKERTPEFYDPQVTFDGHLVNVLKVEPKTKRKKIRLNSSFSKQKRFGEYKILERVTSKKLGPGSYEDVQNFRHLKKKPCPVKIQKSILGERTKNPWYMYIGNSLVFEPEFTKSFNPKESERASVCYYTTDTELRPCSRMWNTIHSTSIDVKYESSKIKSLKERTNNLPANSNKKQRCQSSTKRK